MKHVNTQEKTEQSGKKEREHKHYKHAQTEKGMRCRWSDSGKDSHHDITHWFVDDTNILDVVELPWKRIAMPHPLYFKLYGSTIIYKTNTMLYRRRLR